MVSYLWLCQRKKRHRRMWIHGDGVIQKRSYVCEYRRLVEVKYVD